MSPSHLTHTWRVSPQANSALEHPLNPAPRALGQRQSCAPGRWRARDGSGARVGAGTCMAYQLRGRVLGGWVGVQCGCSAPPPLWIWGWTLGWIWGCILGWVPSGEHRQVFSLRLLCRVWKRVWIKPQGLASLPAIRGAGEEPAPPHGPETSIPQAVPAGPTGSGLAQPLSPGSKGSGGWSSAGCRQCTLSHPLQPAKLPGPGSITHQDPAQHGGDAGGLGPRQHEEWL